MQTSNKVEMACRGIVLVIYCCVTDNHKLSSFNNTHQLPHGIYGSGVQAQLSWSSVRVSECQLGLHSLLELGVLFQAHVALECHSLQL